MTAVTYSSALRFPGSGLPMRATGMKKHIWPIATVSVHSALWS
jgi:hypothetical protein